MKIITENGKKFKVSDDGKVKSFYRDEPKAEPKKVKISTLTDKKFYKIVLERLGIKTED